MDSLTSIFPNLIYKKIDQYHQHYLLQIFNQYLNIWRAKVDEQYKLDLSFDQIYSIVHCDKLDYKYHLQLNDGWGPLMRTRPPIDMTETIVKVERISVSPRQITCHLNADQHECSRFLTIIKDFPDRLFFKHFYYPSYFPVEEIVIKIAVD